MQVQQPGAPRVADMGEHRERVDEVEAIIRLRERRERIVDEPADRRIQMRVDPGDARLVDVAAPELGVTRFRQEVAERPADATAEVEHPLALPRPARGQMPLDGLAGAVPDRLVPCERAVRADGLPHPVGKLDGRERSRHAARE
jgi:hypothetical protein